MPIGQGHTSYGRYARERGVNPLRLVAMQIDDKSGDLAWAASRARVSNTGERMSIVKTDGVTRTLGRQILGPADGHT
jgi:molybdopterin-containing oxidoreductase family iron-sulfur binding subunit